MVGLPDEYVPRGHSSKYPPPLTPRQTRRCHLPSFLFGQRVFGCQLYEVGDDRLNYTLASVARRIQKIFPDTEIEQVESADGQNWRSEEHTSELQSHLNLVCRLLLEKKKR